MRNKHYIHPHFPYRGLPVLFLVCLWMFFLPSCLIDTDKMDTEVPEGSDTEVTISIAVPFPVLPTKSLTAADEETISSIELFVFDTSGKYLYTSHADDITIDPINSDIKNFKTILKTGTADIVLLANCRDILHQHYSTGIADGTTKDGLTGQLTLALSGKWLTDTADPEYRHIPMWGEIGTVNITSSTTQLGSTPFDIHRMVARVDVTTSLPLQTDFKMTSVRLYYYNDAGQVIPTSTNFLADKPSVPSLSNTVKGPLVYDGAAIAPDASGNPACIREIYLFEAKAGNRFTHPENVCLVVGGEYKGIPGFYRVDFQRTTMSGKVYLDILRNHHYQVIITDVEDIGFTDPEEALQAYPVNLSAQVIDWTDNPTEDISIGGNYTLKISTDELVFGPGSSTQMMYIYTDHPQGWKFVEDNFVPAVSWISFDPVKGNPGTYTEVKVTVQENTDTNLRFYEFPLVVDNVKKDLMFAQRGTDDVDLEIYVTPNPVLLGKQMSTPVELKVSTYPANMPLYFEYTGDIIWDSTYGIPADGTITNTIQLLPTNNATVNLLTGYLTIYITDTYGHIASCIVEFHQTTKITGFNATLSNPYPATPGNYSFQLESTVPWQVDYISDGAAWIPGFGMSIQPPTTLSGKSFQLASNPLYQDRTIDVSIYAPDAGEYETLEFKQLHIAPTLTATDGLTIHLPAATGQKITHKFLTNADWDLTVIASNTDWTALGVQINSPLSGTVEAYDLQQTGIELETTEYPLSIATPAAGTYTQTNALNVKISNYAPYILTTAENTLNYTIIREVPPIVQPRGNFLTLYGPYDDIYDTTPAPESTKYHASTNSGEHNLRLAFYANTGFDLWTSFDTGTVHTYNFTGTQLGDAYVTVPIPENKTKANREFTVYVQPHNTSEVKTFLYEQKGYNITVSIASPTGNIPTGGTDLVVKIEDPGGWMSASHQVAVYYVVDGELAIMNKTPSNLRDALKSYIYSSPGEKVIPLQPHPGVPQSNRPVQIVYAIENKVTGLLMERIFASVHLLGTLSQDWQNHKLSDGYIIARSNIPEPYYGSYPQARVDWVTALDIDDSFLYNSFFSGQSYTYYNYPTKGTAVQSCANYSEPDKPGMQWRVPTVSELQEMYNNRNTIGGFQQDKSVNYNYYWSVEEDTYVSNATIFSFTDVPGTSTKAGSTYILLKTGTSGYYQLEPLVRCVSRTK